MKRIALTAAMMTMVNLVATVSMSGENIRSHVFTCCNDDGPGCACFHDSGSWNPSGTWIQDVANMTLGTTESCVDDGGKPYYQMRLGLSDINVANVFACLWDILLDPNEREAWCSETISYWHREKSIPYSSGFQNSIWHLDWQLENTNAIRSFYMVEEILPWGRGRWIDHHEPDYLDYEDFRPGENIPVPGSYVFIQQYVKTGPNSGTWLGCSHSLMIDSMFVYRQIFPTFKIVKVKIKFLEGNSGTPGVVKNTRTIDDIFQATPAGSSCVSYCADYMRKIKGFGIDLDSDRDPIYDPGRLKYLNLPSEAPEPVWPPQPDDIADHEWDLTYAGLIPKLVDYAEVLGGPGPKVTSSSELVEMPEYPMPQVPDGADVCWIFPSSLDRYEPNGVQVDIDLAEDHPLPIKGIVLGWDCTFIPDGYKVSWASHGDRYTEVSVPSLAGMAPPDTPGVFPVPVMFGDPGVTVRHVRLSFPYRTFTQTASLQEIRLLYDWGPDTDATYNSSVGACCLTNGRCLNITESMCETYGGTYQGDDVLCLGDADGNEVDDRCQESNLLGCDVDWSGTVNVLDVVAVINHILGTRLLPPESLSIADCNGDGTINILDVLNCVNVILGIIDECPGSGDAGR